ncbi:PadR family transcriptional regulator [Hoyosella sp. YIM 151337]|uniref:PadR family transcriptional regulator n=1 Tax=Hoyosella sp. YIM 151337 TaxID=2992742 RepID=UPI00223574AC|nr:PadR family transcriptional regulator [Hoyosella sp. YIM 151337]MCW4355773.1 PadR family transcriptional regulator [Hoyosella sp. YIM 151337]
MSAVRLLVLGAVRRRGCAHGYQVRSDLESWGAHEWSTAAPGSIYHALKSMAGRGLLAVHEEAASDAGGPPRIEYELTAEGEAAYFSLLREALSGRDDKLDELTAAVGLIDDLPRAEAIELLHKRAEAMDLWLRSIREHVPTDANLDEWGPVGEVIGLWTTTARTRAEWTRGLISRLEGGAFTMADER